MASNVDDYQNGNVDEDEEEDEEEEEKGGVENSSVKTTKKPRKKREKTITSNDTYKCGLCSFTTGYIGMFDRHLRKHTTDGNKNQFKCKYCEKIFRDQPSLTNHSNMHLGIKPHKCETCETSFGTKGELERHIKYRHTQEKPQKCPECDYSTVEKTKLRRHMRVHTKERPYVCGFCDYASSDTFRLKRHLRIHTGEKPYVCPHCGRSFAQSNTLKSHIKVFHSNSQQNTEITAGESSGRRGRKRKQQSLSSSSSSVSPKVKKKSVEEEKKKEEESGTVRKQPTRRSKTGVKVVVEEDEKHSDEVDQPKSSWSSSTAFLMVQQDDETSSSTGSTTTKTLPAESDLVECPECSMKFSKDLFQEHYVKHTGDRPFECETCKLKFSHKFALRAHQRSHDPSYRTSRLQQMSKSRNEGIRGGGKSTGRPPITKSKELIETSTSESEAEDESGEDEGGEDEDEERGVEEEVEKPRTILIDDENVGQLVKSEFSNTKLVDRDPPIVTSHFHVTGEPHRLFLLNQQPCDDNLPHEEENFEEEDLKTQEEIQQPNIEEYMSTTTRSGDNRSSSSGGEDDGGDNKKTIMSILDDLIDVIETIEIVYRVLDEIEDLTREEEKEEEVDDTEMAFKWKQKKSSWIPKLDDDLFIVHELPASKNGYKEVENKDVLKLDTFMTNYDSSLPSPTPLLSSLLSSARPPPPSLPAPVRATLESLINLQACQQQQQQQQQVAIPISMPVGASIGGVTIPIATSTIPTTRAAAPIAIPIPIGGGGQSAPMMAIPIQPNGFPASQQIINYHPQMAIPISMNQQYQQFQQQPQMAIPISTIPQQQQKLSMGIPNSINQQFQQPTAMAIPISSIPQQQQQQQQQLPMGIPIRMPTTTYTQQQQQPQMAIPIPFQANSPMQTIFIPGVGQIIAPASSFQQQQQPQQHPNVIQSPLGTIIPLNGGIGGIGGSLVGFGSQLLGGDQIFRPLVAAPGIQLLASFSNGSAASTITPLVTPNTQIRSPQIVSNSSPIILVSSQQQQQSQQIKQSGNFKPPQPVVTKTSVNEPGNPTNQISSAKTSPSKEQKSQQPQQLSHVCSMPATSPFKSPSSQLDSSLGKQQQPKSAQISPATPPTTKLDVSLSSPIIKSPSIPLMYSSATRATTTTPTSIGSSPAPETPSSSRAATPSTSFTAYWTSPATKNTPGSSSKPVEMTSPKPAAPPPQPTTPKTQQSLLNISNSSPQPVASDSTKRKSLSSSTEKEKRKLEKSMEEARVAETILDSIESTIVLINGKPTTTTTKSEDDKKIEKDPEYRFKKGQRKKAIQAAENSFVIMDQSDACSPNSSPKKKPKFLRCNSDVEVYMASRRKLKQVENEDNKDDEDEEEDDDSVRDELKNGCRRLLEKSSAKCDICGCCFLNENCLMKHVRIVHKHVIRKEREAKDASERDHLLSHLNSTLSQTSRPSEASDRNETETSFKRFQSDSSLLTSLETTSPARRASVYTRTPQKVVDSSPQRTYDQDNADSSPHSSLMINITYKKTPTRSTPKKSPSSPQKKATPIRTPAKKKLDFNADNMDTACSKSIEASPSKMPRGSSNNRKQAIDETVVIKTTNRTPRKSKKKSHLAGDDDDNEKDE